MYKEAPPRFFTGSCWTLPYVLPGTQTASALPMWEPTSGDFNVNGINLLSSFQPSFKVKLQLFTNSLHPWKLTWHWKITMFNRKYILKWWIFQCHVSFRRGYTQGVFWTVRFSLPFKPTHQLPSRFSFTPVSIGGLSTSPGNGIQWVFSQAKTWGTCSPKYVFR